MFQLHFGPGPPFYGQAGCLMNRRLPDCRYPAARRWFSSSSRPVPKPTTNSGHQRGRYHGAVAFWCLKIAEQQQYPEREGETYVFDNRHSTRVAAGDRFVYEAKVGHGKLLFLRSGSIARVDERLRTAT